MTELGSGIKLDGDFDFSVDSSGDVSASRELDELQKDIALAVTEVLTTGSVEKLPDVYQDIRIPSTISAEFNDDGERVNGGVVGDYLNDGLLNDVEVLVANLIAIDERIEVVTFVDARRDRGENGTLIVNARAIIAELSTEENFEFVIAPS